MRTGILLLVVTILAELVGTTIMKLAGLRCLILAQPFVSSGWCVRSVNACGREEKTITLNSYKINDASHQNLSRWVPLRG